MPLAPKILKTYSEFECLRNQWNDLLAQATERSVFLTWEWLNCWWKAYHASETPYIILFEDEKGMICGIAPFFKTTVKGPFSLSYNAITFWGLRTAVKESEYLDIIALPGQEKEIIKQTVLTLAKEQDLDLLLFHEVPAESKLLPLLRQELASQGWLTAEANHGCSVIHLPDSYDEYLQTLKPRMRTRARSLPKKLLENHEIAFSVCERKEEIGEKLSSLINLHQARWEADGQLGTFRHPGRTEFYQLVADAFCDSGWLRLFSLQVDGTYRAHEFGFLYENKLYILQEAYDKDWEKQGVGNVLRTFSIQYCIDNGISEYDFLGGVTFHKSSWGVHIKNSILLSAFRKNMKNTIYFQAPLFKEKAKDVCRILVPKKLIQWRRDFHTAMIARKAKKQMTHFTKDK